MIEEQEAFEIIAEQVRPTRRSVEVTLEDGLGRVAAVDMLSRHPMPRFANSMVDGYALADVPAEKGATFRLVGEQPAGVDLKLRLASGETVRIFTGHPFPKARGRSSCRKTSSPMRPGGFDWRIGSTWEREFVRQAMT